MKTVELENVSADTRADSSDYLLEIRAITIKNSESTRVAKPQQSINITQDLSQFLHVINSLQTDDGECGEGKESRDQSRRLSLLSTGRNIAKVR